MPRAIFVHDGAAWRKARNLWVHDGAAWRKATRLHVHDGAAWRESGTSGPVNFGGLTSSRYDIGNTSVSVMAYFQTNGRIRLWFGSIEYSDWYLENEVGAGSGYWIKATLQSGSGPSYGTLGQWLPLSEEQYWQYNSGAAGAYSGRTGTLRIDISPNASDANIVATGTVHFRAEREY